MRVVLALLPRVAVATIGAGEQVTGNDMEIGADRAFAGVMTLDHAIRKQMAGDELPGDADPAQHFDSRAWRSEAHAAHAAGAIAYFADVRKIWDHSRAGHGYYYIGWPDLVRFKGAFYACFKETSYHAGVGAGRVIRSPDGTAWFTVWTFPGDGQRFDTTGLSVTSDNRLMLICRAHKWQGGDRIQSLTCLSDDGENWDGPHASPTLAGVWIWSAEWHEGIGYAMGMGGEKSARTSALYTTRNGRDWEVLVDGFWPDGKGTEESSIVFDDDDIAYCLLRGAPRGKTLGVAEPPYTNWTWKWGADLGGPRMIRLRDGRFLAGGRLIGVGPQRTSLVWIDPTRNIPESQANEFVTFPSGGDTGYPGIVEHDGFIWVVYYSREGQEKAAELGIARAGHSKDLASIYLARIKLAPRPAPCPLLNRPPAEGPRFEDHGDGTVTDRRTGLMWARALVHHKKWPEARAHCESLVMGEHDDWRLPAVRELRSLVDWGSREPVTLPAGHPFENFLPHAHRPIWSSEVFRDWAGNPTPYVWYMNLTDGSVFINNRLKSVWAVRGGQTHDKEE